MIVIYEEEIDYYVKVILTVYLRGSG